MMRVGTTILKTLYRAISENGLQIKLKTEDHFSQVVYMANPQPYDCDNDHFPALF